MRSYFLISLFHRFLGKFSISARNAKYFVSKFTPPKFFFKISITFPYFLPKKVWSKFLISLFPQILGNCPFQREIENKYSVFKISITFPYFLISFPKKFELSSSFPYFIISLIFSSKFVFFKIGNCSFQREKQKKEEKKSVMLVTHFPISLFPWFWGNCPFQQEMQFFFSISITFPYFLPKKVSSSFPHFLDFLKNFFFFF